MRRVELTDCGCCRLVGVCETGEGMRAGAVVGLWQSRDEVSREGPIAHGRFGCVGSVNGQQKVKRLEVDATLRRY